MSEEFDEVSAIEHNLLEGVIACKNGFSRFSDGANWCRRIDNACHRTGNVEGMSFVLGYLYSLFLSSSCTQSEFYSSVYPTMSHHLLRFT